MYSKRAVFFSLPGALCRGHVAWLECTLHISQDITTEHRGHRNGWKDKVSVQ